MGRAGGLCKGLGGPGHLVDVEHGLMGSTGGNPAVAAGSALAAKLRGDDQVVVAFLDESEAHRRPVRRDDRPGGAVGLPVIFVCENGGGPFRQRRRRPPRRPDPDGRRQRRGGGLGGVDAPARRTRARVTDRSCSVPSRGRRADARTHSPLPTARRRRGLDRRRRRWLDRAGVATGGRGGRESARDSPAPTAALSEQLTSRATQASRRPSPTTRVFVLGEGSLAAPVSASTLCGVAIGLPIGHAAGGRPVDRRPCAWPPPVTRPRRAAISPARGAHAAGRGRVADVPGLKVAMPGQPAGRSRPAGRGDRRPRPGRPDRSRGPPGAGVRRSRSGARSCCGPAAT